MLYVKKIAFVGCALLASLAVYLVVAGSFQASPAYIGELSSEDELESRFCKNFKDQAELMFCNLRENPEYSSTENSEVDAGSFDFVCLINMDQDSKIGIKDVRVLLVSAYDAMLEAKNSAGELDPNAPFYKKIGVTLSFEKEKSPDFVAKSGIVGAICENGKISYIQQKFSPYNGTVQQSDALVETYQEAHDRLAKKGLIIPATNLFGSK
jgi:hypothetical protein